jgi:uncharacterized protein YbaA (DUF1428 family)
MQYVDGFLLPVPKKNLQAYRRLARKAGKIWREHGMPFPRLIKLKPGETVVFAWIVFKSRAHRDRVNAKVMKDPWIATMSDPNDMPFDVKRMAYGGFKTLVAA